MRTAIAPGKLRSKIARWQRLGGNDSDLGGWEKGADRRAEIISSGPNDEQVAAGIVGVDTCQITVWSCAETRSWTTADRLEEIYGPSGLTRIFEITAPIVPDETGRWLIITAAAGVVNLED